jgi:hypothetical protein
VPRQSPKRFLVAALILVGLALAIKLASRWLMPLLMSLHGGRPTGH